MIQNYFKIAFRTLTKSKSYSAINIFGLALSLSAAILIMLWVWDELSYDRMHNKADRIYQLSTTFDITSENLWPVGPVPLAVFAQSEVPGIEAACRFNHSGATLVKTGDHHTFNEEGMHVDSSFFLLFDFPLRAGDRQHPFPDKHSIILSQTLAKKYFGEQDAMGQTVRINLDAAGADGSQLLRVTGIMEDLPLNSSIKADFLLPFALLDDQWVGGLNEQWGNFGFPTYFLLAEKTDAEKIETQLAQIHQKANDAEIFKTLVYFLQPLPSVHLYNAKGQEQGMQQVRIFALVALIILLIASINYVNLVTARSIRRSKEVGVRKVVGADRRHLFWQFIAESLVVFLIAMVLAIAVTYAAMPLYNSLSGKEMAFNLFDAHVWILFGGTLVLVILLAGVYPALLLSTFQPTQALKGLLPGMGKNNGFRKVLVIVQFSCSVVLIIATAIISQQLAFIKKKELGYDKENVLLFNQRNFLNRFDAIRAELQNAPEIKGVTAASSDISKISSGTGDIDWEGKPASMANFTVNFMSVDHQFLDVLGIRLADGRGFTGTPADSVYVVLNETAVKQMGLTEPVIGKSITFRYTPRTIVGVIEDFHFADLKKAVGPCVLFVDRSVPWNGMYIKTSRDQAAQAIVSIEKLWQRYNSEYEFDYRFMDESFDRLYKSDIQAGKLFNVFAGIAILISCLGLFGLVTFTAETKVREIGIRKTLGASVTHIILLISRDFLKLVVISFMIAFPLGWWLMNKWLDNYAYRTDIEWWVFAIAGLVAFTIAAITVCGKSLRAAKANPIKAIRTE